jgi:hypothetical protein
MPTFMLEISSARSDDTGVVSRWQSRPVNALTPSTRDSQESRGRSIPGGVRIGT